MKLKNSSYIIYLMMDDPKSDNAAELCSCTADDVIKFLLVVEKLGACSSAATAAPACGTTGGGAGTAS